MVNDVLELESDKIIARVRAELLKEKIIKTGSGSAIPE